MILKPIFTDYKKNLDQLTQTFRGYRQFESIAREDSKSKESTFKPQGSSQRSQPTREWDSARHLGKCYNCGEENPQRDGWVCPAIQTLSPLSWATVRTNPGTDPQVKSKKQASTDSPLTLQVGKERGREALALSPGVPGSLWATITQRS